MGVETADHAADFLLHGEQAFMAPPTFSCLSSMTHLHHGFPASADVRDVADACNALNVKEIELFRLAHLRWFGHEVDDNDLERPFMHYLFTQRAPPWVRHCTREVLHQESAGTLDRTRFGLPLQDAPADKDGLWVEACRVLWALTWLVAIAVIAVNVSG